MNTQRTLVITSLTCLLCGILLTACGSRSDESAAVDEDSSAESVAVMHSTGKAAATKRSEALSISGAGAASTTSPRTVTGTVATVEKSGGASSMISADDIAFGGGDGSVTKSLGVRGGRTSAFGATASVAPREASADFSYASAPSDGSFSGDVAVSGDMAVSADPIASRKTKATSETTPEREEAEEQVERAGQLTAGEWNDLTEWTFWNSVIASGDWNRMKEHWGFGYGQRVSIQVDNGTTPITDAVAKLYNKEGTLLWTAHTDNFGRAELFTGLDKPDEHGPYDVVVTSGGKETRMGAIDPSREQSPSESPLMIRMRQDPAQLRNVDVMFALDATGSMGDELNYIKAELESVIDRVEREMEGRFSIRVGANVYRDEGDEYIVRSHPFTENVGEVAAFLREQQANGGGDTPEAVEEALIDAIEGHGWSSSAQARFLFLVLDAPPHYTDDRLERIRQLTRNAADQGIRIIPVSGSGVDKETEFLMRFLGIHTGGTYTFLTDHSGIGESHLEPTVGSYAVEFLDDLIVRLIVQYTQRPTDLDAIAAGRKPTIY